MTFRNAIPERPLVIELLGLAGSGKTSLSRCLQRSVPGICAGMSVYQLPPLLVGAELALTAPTYFGSARVFHSGAMREMKQIARLRAMRRFLGGQASKPRRALVLDEGPLYAMSWLAVFGSEKNGPDSSQWWRRELRQWLSRVDAVVWLDASDTELIRRIRSREKPHAVKEWDDGSIRQFLRRYREAYARVVAFAESSGSRILRFDTEEETTEQIAVRIVDLLDLAEGRGRECLLPA